MKCCRVLIFVYFTKKVFKSPKDRKAKNKTGACELNLSVEGAKLLKTEMEIVPKE